MERHSVGPGGSGLIAELGEKTGGDGGQAWADAVGVVPVAAITVAKLRWLADNEPENADAPRRFAFRTTG